jgi:methionyl-tRNA formyltransferase
MQTKVIFFGNGLLADSALKRLESADSIEVIFHAREKADLETVKTLKAENPDAKAVLASFGVMIKSDVLDIFEPEGILNIHPSLLPKYRGASPIESAIIAGDKDFSVSVMKLVKAMDAGPLYYQTTLKAEEFSSEYPEKTEIYEKLATAGAGWIIEHINNLPAPTEQDDSEATFTTKFDTSMSVLDLTEPAVNLLNQIRAFQTFPKSKIIIADLECTIIKAHLATENEVNTITTTDTGNQIMTTKKLLAIKAGDGNYLIIDQLQPAGRKIMDAIAFKNGYMK